VALGPIILARRATTPRRPHRLPRPRQRRLRRLFRRRAARRLHADRAGQRVPARRLRERRDAGAQAVEGIEKPSEKLSKSKTYIATISTTCGDIEVTLDSKRSPVTGGSFKYLADQKFFDGTTFHRVVADFVIQGGDPAGDGSGGPGYSVEEAPDESLKYEKGVVAMAKTGAEPAGTSGSQFFIVTGDGALSLTPDYALLGTVTKGMDVAEKIGGIQADPSTGQPAAQVIIKSVTVAEE
jgi:peptidyl-prolyl cis-trans isomerase B (cyclophilin B)